MSILPGSPYAPLPHLKDTQALTKIDLETCKRRAKKNGFQNFRNFPRTSVVKTLRESSIFFFSVHKFCLSCVSRFSMVDLYSQYFAVSRRRWVNTMGNFHLKKFLKRKRKVNKPTHQNPKEQKNRKQLKKTYFHINLHQYLSLFFKSPLPPFSLSFLFILLS